MVEAERENENPVIEISINTGNATEDTAVEQLLQTLGAEDVIRRTLHLVKVELPVMLTLLICGDEEMQALNRQYRQQNKPTDVLSFPLLDEPLVEAPAAWLWQTGEDEKELPQVPQPSFVTPDELLTNLGDIVISWPTTQRQAHAAGHPAGYELLFLLCHGVLHLLGYDDATEDGYTAMVNLQKESLTGLSQEG